MDCSDNGSFNVVNILSGTWMNYLIAAQYYSLFLAGAMVTAALDFEIKYTETDEEYNKLPWFMKGLIWSTIVNIPYMIMVTWISYKLGWQFMVGLLGIINSDGAYYMLKSFNLGKLQYNSWFPCKRFQLWKSKKQYYMSILVINCIMIGVLCVEF